MWKYAVVLSYTGGSFCGWQRQQGRELGLTEPEEFPSVQMAVETAVARITSEEPSVVGSGRTDSGVHAVGQVAHFVLKRKEWDPAILHKGLNSVLPKKIRAVVVRLVPIEFHAQRTAVKKQYSYYFQQGPCSLPHLEPYSWWIRKRLDREAIGEALGHLRGEHDFKPFRAAGAKPGSSVRKILEAEVTWEPLPFPMVQGGPTGIPLDQPFGLVRVRLVGTGFLKQMVRSIAGTLLQVGEGRRNPDCIREILVSGDRTAVGATAQPRGLWLEKVWYPEAFEI